MRLQKDSMLRVMCGRMMTLAALCALTALALSAVAFRGTAWAAADYSFDELSTDLQLQSNDTAQIVERKIATFSGENKGMVWYLYEPSDTQFLKIRTMNVVPVDDGGAPLDNWVALSPRAPQPRLQGMNPGDSASYDLRQPDVAPWYSYYKKDGMIRCYFPVEEDISRTYMIETVFTVENLASVYRDVGELFWTYASDRLAVDARNVSLQITLPVPVDTPFIPGEDVMAWGHGSTGGEYTINPNGTIMYQVPQVKAGNYADAHVIFPVSWLSDVGDANPQRFTELHKENAIQSEAGWVDIYALGALWDYRVRMLFFALAAVVLAVGVVFVVRDRAGMRSRRILLRTACTLLVIGLFAQLFFFEPLTVGVLLGMALVVALVALFIPQHRTDEPNAEPSAPEVGERGDRIEVEIIEDADDLESGIELEIEEGSALHDEQRLDEEGKRSGGEE